MYITAVDTPSGRECELEAGLSDLLGTLLDDIRKALDYDSDTHLDLSTDGSPLDSEPSEPIASLQLVCGSRVDVTPTWAHHADSLRNGYTTLCYLPPPAWKDRACAFAAITAARDSRRIIVPHPALWSDPDIMLAAVACSSGNFHRASPEHRTDPVFAAAAVSYHGELYWALPEALRLLPSIAKHACHGPGLLERCVEHAMCNNHEVALAAMSASSSAYHQVGAELRADVTFSRAVAAMCDDILRYLPEAHCDDTEVVEAAVNRDPSNLALASERCRSDKALVLRVAEERCMDLGYVGEALRDDRDVVSAILSACLKHCNRESPNCTTTRCAGSLCHASARLRDDKDVVISAVRRHPEALRDASDAMQRDVEVLLACAEGLDPLLIPADVLSDRPAVLRLAPSCPAILRHVPLALQRDTEVALAAISSGSHAASELRDVLHQAGHFSSRAFMLEAVPECSSLLDVMGDSLRGDRELLLLADYISCASYSRAPPELQRDREVVCAALDSGAPLSAICAEARHDKAVVLHALGCCPHNLRYVCDALRDDKDIGLAVAGGTGLYFAWLSDRLRQDPDVASIAVAAEPANKLALRGCLSCPAIAAIAVSALPIYPGKWEERITLRCCEMTSLPVDCLRGDRDITLADVRSCHTLYWRLSDALRADTEMACAALEGGADLRGLEEPMRSTRKVVEHAIEHADGIDPDAFSAASDTFRGHKRLALAAVRRNPGQLRAASPALRDDKEVVLAAAAASTRHCGVLEAASPRLCQDSDVLCELLAHCPGLFPLLPAEVRGRRDVALAAVACSPHDAFELLSPALRRDREVLLSAKYLTQRMLCLDPPLEDKEVVLKLVAHNVGLLPCCSPALLADRDVALAALGARCTDGMDFDCLDVSVRNDPEVAEKALEVGCLRTSALLGDRGFVMAGLGVCPGVFRWVAPELLADKEVVLEAVRLDADNFSFASAPLQADRDVVLAAVAGGFLLSRAQSSMVVCDKEVVLATIGAGCYSILRAGDALLDDEEVGLAMCGSPESFPRLSDRLRDNKDIALVAVRADGDAFFQAGESVRADKDVALACLQSTRCVPDFLPFCDPALREDRDVVLAAITTGCRNLNHASPDLQDDPEILNAYGGAMAW